MSIRCTMPGRIWPPMEERSPKWYSSAFTSVPDSFPTAGWTTMPRGLFTTQISSSSYTISKGMSSGTSSMGFASGTVYRTVSPSRTTSLRRQGRPLTDTSPSSIRLWARDRDSSVISDRQRSSRRYSLSAMSNSSAFMVPFSFPSWESMIPSDRKWWFCPSRRTSRSPAGPRRW